MTRVVFTREITLNGVTYHPGQRVEVRDEVLTVLLEAGVVRLPYVGGEWCVGDPTVRHSDPRRAQ